MLTVHFAAIQGSTKIPALGDVTSDDNRPVSALGMAGASVSILCQTWDYVGLLQHVMRTNLEKGAEFAIQLMNDELGPFVDVEQVVDIFMSQNMIHFILIRCSEGEQTGWMEQWYNAVRSRMH